MGRSPFVVASRRKGGPCTWVGALFHSLFLFLKSAPRASCERKTRETRDEPVSSHCFATREGNQGNEVRRGRERGQDQSKKQETPRRNSRQDTGPTSSGPEVQQETLPRMIAGRNSMNTPSLSETDIRTFSHWTADRNLTTHCPRSETYKAVASETVRSSQSVLGRVTE